MNDNYHTTWDDLLDEDYNEAVGPLSENDDPEITQIDLDGNVSSGFEWEETDFTDYSTLDPYADAIPYTD
ncbi:MAG: hypothetical protein ACR2MS_07895 [Weeksellaceae bacterium]